MDWEGLLNTLAAWAGGFGVKLLCALIALMIGMKVIRWLRKKLPVLPGMDRLDAGVRGFLTSAMAVSLYVLLGVTIAMILGVPTASFIAALASCLAAIGLAMQGSLSNFAGGLMLLIFQPFRVGDYISAPDQSAEGTVQKITVVYTVLLTYDGIEVTIPNGTLTNTVVKNMSIKASRRVEVLVRTAPDAPVDKVEALLARIVAEDARVLSEPAPFARLIEVTGDALVFAVRVWCSNAEYWNLKFDLTRAVKDALDCHGIVVPHSQLDVHLSAPDGK